MPKSVFSDILGREAGLERPAILGDQALSHGELLGKAERLAETLKTFGPANAVFLTLPHGSAYTATTLAAAMCDLVIIPVNPRATDAEKDHLLSDSRAGLIVTEMRDKWPLASSAQPVASHGDIRISRRIGGCEFDREPADRMVIYTSGSTSHPKGVVLSDSAITANVTAVADYLALAPRDRIVCFTPPSYSYAVSQVLTHLWVGGAILPWPGGLVESFKMLAACRDTGVTGIQANPTIFRMLFDFCGDDWIDLPDIRYVQSGGQELHSSMAKAIADHFPACRIVNMYGCTEHAPRISYKWLPPKIDGTDALFPVGRCVASSEVRIVNGEGKALEPGETGEILVKGKSMMSRYYGARELTAERLVDGWLKTRDLGFLDENGDLNIRGRIDNIIIVGHEKVSPEEIEAVLGEVEGVIDIAIGAMPDPVLQFVPVAFVVAVEDFRVVEAKLRQASRTSLSRTKHPRRFIQVDAVPQTPYGKIDRRAVAALKPAR